MSNPYQTSATQSQPAERRQRGLQAVAIATATFVCMLLIIFLKRGELRPEDAGSILILILPVHLALGWYVAPSMRLYFPVLLFIAIVSWVILVCLAPIASLLQGRVPALALHIVGVVEVDLSLILGATVFRLLKIHFMDRLSDEAA